MIISTQRFVQTHLHHSNIPTFISDNSLENNKVEVRQFELRAGVFRSWRINLDTTGFVMDSCLGLLLLYVRSRLHLINPATKQHLELPQEPPSFTRLHSANIAYITHSSEIIVIGRYGSKHSQSYFFGILTVGNNMSWKMFKDTSSLQGILEPKYLQAPNSLGGGGVVIYWSLSELWTKNRILAVNVDDGSVKSIHVPLQFISEVFTDLMINGRDLYLISRLSPGIVIFKLIYFGRSDSEWVESFRTKNVGSEPFRYNRSRYYAWLENDKILIYSKKRDLPKLTRKMMAYDFISRRAFQLQISSCPHLLNFMGHTDSLISF